MHYRGYLRPRYLVLAFVAVAILMVASAVIELYNSKRELMSLMESQSHSLLRTMLIASQNTLHTNAVVEEQLYERLLNNANLITHLYEQEAVNDTLLAKFAKENHIYRINIFSQEGTKLYQSHEQAHLDLPEKMSPAQILRPIFQDITDTLYIGMKQARFESGFRFAVAVAANDRSAIVVNLDAEQLLEFRRSIGFGTLLRNIISNPGIVYAALQDTTGIIAASGNVTQLEGVPGSEFLSKALQDTTFSSRTTAFNSTEVFETVYPFYYRGSEVGIFRLGLSLEPVETINGRIYRRISIITVLLLGVGFIVFSAVLVWQNMRTVEEQYQVVETYSNRIIQNVSDAVIVFNEADGITIFNGAAEKLFGRPPHHVLGKSLQTILPAEECRTALGVDEKVLEVECILNEQKRALLTSSTTFTDENHRDNTILVIRDVTHQKQLEEQVQRKERLSAMGELASGVAHEIRNPLNTISTIVQQLNKDFTPMDYTEEYNKLTRLVYKEVRRINETIEDFLEFARPKPIKPSRFELSEFFQDLKLQHSAILKQHNIDLTLDIRWNGEVFWDKNQMQQVFINLIRNAAEAIKYDGEIQIDITAIDNNTLEVNVRDNGVGIPEEALSRIFNLYYTSRPDGTGIGLSIVQRIIYEHTGFIEVTSEVKTGTRFTIRLPKNVSKMRE